MAKEKSQTFELQSRGETLKKTKKSLESQVKQLTKKMGIKGTEVSRDYSVQLYLGDNPSKGGILGIGNSYDEAIANAREQSPVEITDAYHELIRLSVKIEYSPKELKEAKKKGSGVPAGPVESYETRFVM